MEIHSNIPKNATVDDLLLIRKTILEDPTLPEKQSAILVTFLNAKITEKVIFDKKNPKKTDISTICKN